MSYQYTQLSMGSKDEKSNKQLQQLLNEKIGAGLVVDGIYGAKTNQAVIDYQKKNGLTADGIVGPKTWASLLGSADGEKNAQENTDQKRTTLSEAVAEAKKAYDALSTQTPENMQFDDQALYDQAAQAYLNREGFAYDLNADPMYQQYMDQYTRAGRLAMEDTMGKAAALTGGYGNSYAQTAGQQAYGGYLQQLNERVPELYALAYSKYQQEGEALRDRYELLKERREDAYNRQQDTLDRFDAQRAELYEQYQDRLDRQEDQYQKMRSLIAQGYIPTDAELAAVGLTRRQAMALAQT